MSTPVLPALGSLSTRKRVVRQLPAAPAPAPVTAVVAPATTAPPFFDTFQPKSVFWLERINSLRVAHQSLDKLKAIDTGIVNVSDRVGGISFPSSLSVTTTMSVADAQVVERLATAVEKVADTLETPPGSDCAELSTLTPRSFALVARLTTLAAHLMDRYDVSATSTLEKMDDDDELIAEVRDLLEEAELDDALVPFEGAFDRDPFDALAKDPATDRSPAVFEELQERAALLLAIKCLVATAELEGDSPDWPPQTPAPQPPAWPVLKSTRARP